MKTMLKIAILTPALILLFLVDLPPEVPPPYVQFVPEAQAIFGVRRRAFRRGAIIGASAATATEAAAAQQHAAPAPPPAAPPPQPQAAPAPPPPAAAAGKPLPLGTVVNLLPAGCVTTPVGGVEYYYCGGNFYRAVFQGNSLVYVTAQP